MRIIKGHALRFAVGPIAAGAAAVILAAPAFGWQQPSNKPPQITLSCSATPPSVIVTITGPDYGKAPDNTLTLFSQTGQVLKVFPYNWSQSQNNTLTFPILISQFPGSGPFTLAPTDDYKFVSQSFSPICTPQSPPSPAPPSPAPPSPPKPTPSGGVGAGVPGLPATGVDPTA